MDKSSPALLASASASKFLPLARWVWRLFVWGLVASLMLVPLANWAVYIALTAYVGYESSWKRRYKWRYGALAIVSSYVLAIGSGALVIYSADALTDGFLLAMSVGTVLTGCISLLVFRKILISRGGRG